MPVSFEKQVGLSKVCILYDEDYKPCYLHIEKLFSGEWMTTTDRTFPNAAMLSADLACDLGIGPAREFLHSFDIPKTSRLWHLNHEGYKEDG